MWGEGRVLHPFTPHEIQWKTLTPVTPNISPPRTSPAAPNDSAALLWPAGSCGDYGAHGCVLQQIWMQTSSQSLQPQFLNPTACSTLRSGVRIWEHTRPSNSSLVSINSRLGGLATSASPLLRILGVYHKRKRIKVPPGASKSKSWGHSCRKKVALEPISRHTGVVKWLPVHDAMKKTLPLLQLWIPILCTILNPWDYVANWFAVALPTWARLGFRQGP